MRDNKEYLTTIKQKTYEFENEVRVATNKLKASLEEVEQKNNIIFDQ